ncbi:cell wall metabolism sensor histidine kinase WalK [Caloramator sp. E03]|uniref:sensor histidine kinase n=1 Tax=Caloramator sp. E03 TaxID=2576307 RepID=UPI001110E8F3|nr:ATP-binding protein [Caloramator sp. E03]QCX33575.1 cell wall metabolism sensor histidine kinase WalK [Caloramator sp. E03]
MVIIIKDKAFKEAFRIKIFLSYSVLIIFFLVIINITTNYILRKTYFASFKNELMERAKGISTLITSYGNFIYINSGIIDNAKKSGTRVIIVDKNKTVVFDTSNLLCGFKFGNLDEVETAFKGVENWGKHTTESEDLLYISCPVFNNSNTILGAVLLIHSLNGVYDTVKKVQTHFIIASFFILILGLMLSYIKASAMTQPLEDVIEAIEEIAKGETNKKVYVKGNDEIARLCYVFNNMNEKLNKMDETRRQFIADASHELKSPLASIKVLVQSLLSGGIEDKNISIEFLESINNEVDRLTAIVNNLLELAKLESDKTIVTNSFIEFDILDLCNDVVKKLIPLAKLKNIDIRLKLESIVVEGNRDNIFRAMYNILENAIKYSKENSFIDLWVNKEDMVKINIKDYGIGIPNEEIEHIFKRFYRVDKTRDRKTGGCGLGLSIAYDIIKLHKGDIRVYSKVGEGSLFVITLPYKQN